MHDFLMLWARKAAAREQARPDSASVVAQLRKAEIKVLRVRTNNLRIDKGAVLTLNNPLTRLDFDTVTVIGDLVVNGDLIFNCNTLTVR